jgi:hypothetical protein
MGWNGRDDTLGSDGLHSIGSFKGCLVGTVIRLFDLGDLSLQSNLVSEFLGDGIGKST